MNDLLTVIDEPYRNIFVCLVLLAFAGKTPVLKDVIRGIEVSLVWIVRQCPQWWCVFKEALRHPEADPNYVSKPFTWILLIIVCSGVIAPMLFLSFICTISAIYQELPLLNQAALLALGIGLFVISSLYRNDAIRNAQRAGIDLYPWRNWWL